MTLIERRMKVGAYTVCLRQDRILLARYVPPDGSQRHWTLPGGKVEHGEETGYQVEVERLLGVDSRTHRVDWGIPGGAELHSIGIFYGVRIIGGQLRHEVGGSTDLADWIPIANVPNLERASIVDIGLELERILPLSGHANPVPVRGLLRH